VPAEKITTTSSITTWKIVQRLERFDVIWTGQSYSNVCI